jgi:hypothetical protein
MESWKSGESIDSLRQGTPEVVVQDMEWMQGAQLVDYEILGPGEAVDANLLCKVKLDLRDATGKTASKTVTYIVGTDPVLTVFRQIF